MNIKRGLKRLWVVGTVLWFSIFYFSPGNFDPSRDLGTFFGVPIVSWILLYMGFWVSSGFSSDKKKDETNE